MGDADEFEERFGLVCCSVGNVSASSGEDEVVEGLGSLARRWGVVDDVVKARGRRGGVVASYARAGTSWGGPCLG